MSKRILLAGILATAALIVAPVADAAPQPDVVLHGTVSGADNQTWRLVPFDVPAGTTRITVDFDYTTRDERTTIDLGVLGPDGFRGWSGGNNGSTLEPPDYQRLEGPWTNGQDPAAGRSSSGGSRRQ